MPSTRRGRAAVREFMWGAAAAALYLRAVAYTWPLAPVRILYEGEAPPLPYRWVHPPAELSRDNQPPEFGAGRIAFSPQGSQSTSIVTDDGQAGVIFRFGAIAPRTGATSAQVKVVPLDPAPLPRPPSGLRLDGNAYRVDATYNTGEPIVLRIPMTAVLRYPRHATMLLRLTGETWTALDAHIVPGSLQIFAGTDRVGVFAAAGPAGPPPAAWIGYAVAAAAVLGAAAAIAARRLRARRRDVGGTPA